MSLQRQIAYVVAPWALAALMGCPGNSGAVSQSTQPVAQTTNSGLETKVEDLDLSTPEKTIEYFFDALKAKNRELMTKVTTSVKDKEISDAFIEFDGMQGYRNMGKEGPSYLVKIILPSGEKYGVLEIVHINDKYFIRELAPK